MCRNDKRKPRIVAEKVTEMKRLNQGALHYKHFLEFRQQSRHNGCTRPNMAAVFNAKTKAWVINIKGGF